MAVGSQDVHAFWLLTGLTQGGYDPRQSIAGGGGVRSQSVGGHPGGGLTVWGHLKASPGFWSMARTPGG
jgi:hypothetical protein